MKRTHNGQNLQTNGDRVGVRQGKCEQGLFGACIKTATGKDPIS